MKKGPRLRSRGLEKDEDEVKLAPSIKAPSPCPSPWREEAERRWPHGTILPPGNMTDGFWAVVTWCRKGALPIISLHATYLKARDVLAGLNTHGCSRGCRIAYHEQHPWHEIVNLRTGRRSRR
jgi:hypothetical protein